jgi:hypothetical protein
VAARPGTGSVGAGGSVPRLGDQAAIIALAGGRPQPAVGFGVGPARIVSTSIVISSNARDPARAVLEFGGRAFAPRPQAAGSG